MYNKYYNFIKVSHYHSDSICLLFVLAFIDNKITSFNDFQVTSLLFMF